MSKSNRTVVVCSNSICDACFHKHSPRTECTHPQLTACKSCFRVNVRSATCTCDHHMYSSPQILRMVGQKSGPFWYVDIQIFDQAFPAMINTSILKCRVNHQLSVWLQITSNGVVDNEATEIIVPITRKDGRIAEVCCDINKPQLEMMELGQQFLKYAGYVLTLGDDTIDSQQSPLAKDPQEVNYVYNLPEGQELRLHLNNNRKFLKQSRVAKIEDWPAESKRVIVRAKHRRSTQDSVVTLYRTFTYRS